MRKNILILSNRETYIKNIFCNKDIDIEYSYSNINIFFKIIRRLWHFFNINNFKVWYDFKEKNINFYDTIIIFESIYPIDIIKYIRKTNKQCRIIYWLWNPVSTLKKDFMYDKYKEFLNLLKKRYDKNLNFEIWSFDKIDCKRYNLKYNNQVSYKVEMQKQEIKWDFFFCGKDKNRLDKIKKIKEKFSKYKFKILVLPDKDKYYDKDDEQYILSDPITYLEIIKYINQSRCIIDIVQDGQGGITWRPLEAMFYKKKLLTNYLDIKNYDFYNKDNIFIIENDDEKKIDIFLKQSYQEISSEIIEQYLVDGWLKNFFYKF